MATRNRAAYARPRLGWLVAVFVAACLTYGASAWADAVAITAADIKGITTPSTDDLAKGDPGGSMTGSAADIVMADSKAGLTVTDVVNQVGQNRIAVNFVWTLVAGFLVMF